MIDLARFLLGYTINFIKNDEVFISLFTSTSILQKKTCSREIKQYPKEEIKADWLKYGQRGKIFWQDQQSRPPLQLYPLSSEAILK